MPDTSPQLLAIVLTFDQLPCAALGCYGNEWIDTPHFNRLAANGFVFDAHVARSIEGNIWLNEPADWWSALTGTDVHPLQIREVNSPFPWDRAEWANVVCVEGRDGRDVPPREWPFAALLRAGSDWLARTAEKHPRRLLWLHSAGVPSHCEVPTEVESLYVDEFADRGVAWSELSEEQRSRHPAVQAAYVSCLDHILGEFLETLTGQPLLIAIAALHGGYWQTIPRRCDLPRRKEAQWLRSPAIWCLFDAARAILPGRSPALVQPMDLGPTLLEWFEPSLRDSGPGLSLWPIFEGTAPRVREAALIDGGVLWTEHDVTVLTEPSLDPATIRRFLWPEDLWQVNDVAPLTPDVVAERVAWLHEHGKTPACGGVTGETSGS